LVYVADILSCQVLPIDPLLSVIPCSVHPKMKEDWSCARCIQAKSQRIQAQTILNISSIFLGHCYQPRSQAVAARKLHALNHSKKCSS